MGSAVVPVSLLPVWGGHLRCYWALVWRLLSLLSLRWLAFQLCVNGIQHMFKEGDDCKFSSSFCVRESDYQMVWRQICVVYCVWDSLNVCLWSLCYLPTCVYVFDMGMNGLLKRPTKLSPRGPRTEEALLPTNNNPTFVLIPPAPFILQLYGIVDVQQHFS